jgi:acyl-ACP thioesterase
MRFPPDFVSVYEESAAGRDAHVRLRHPDPPSGASLEPWHFRSTEMDPAGHINNSHYWTPLEENLAAGPEPEWIDAEIEYRDPAMAGEALVLTQGSTIWVTSPEGAVHASLLRV